MCSEKYLSMGERRNEKKRGSPETCLIYTLRIRAWFFQNEDFSSPYQFFHLKLLSGTDLLLSWKKWPTSVCLVHPETRLVLQGKPFSCSLGGLSAFLLQTRVHTHVAPSGKSSRFPRSHSVNPYSSLRS